MSRRRPRRRPRHRRVAEPGRCGPASRVSRCRALPGCTGTPADRWRQRQRDHRGRARGESLKYWDSSALVALLVEEPGSARRQEAMRHDPMIVTWWGSRIECASALNRLEREGRFEGRGFDRSMDRLGLLAEAWIQIEPLEQVRKRAMRLLRLHPLRAADALQLAAALAAADEDPQRLDLVSSDDRLSRAAHREGFTVL